jgi:hypothetical protein
MGDVCGTVSNFSVALKISYPRRPTTPDFLPAPHDDVVIIGEQCPINGEA